MMKQILAAAAVFAVLGAAGCSKGSDTAVVARVNQAKITVADYKRQLEGLDNFQMEQAVASDPKARKDFLEDLIGIELAMQEARRLGLDKEAEHKKSLESIRKEYEETKKRLEKRYQEAVRNELFKALLKKELADKAAKLEPPTDKEVREFYEKNRDRMVTMDGKRLAYKDVVAQLRNRLLQEKQRGLYLAYIQSLREKATVKVDDKVLDALASSLSGTMTLEVPQAQQEKAPAEGKPDAGKGKQP